MGPLQDVHLEHTGIFTPACFCKIRSAPRRRDAFCKCSNTQMTRLISTHKDLLKSLLLLRVSFCRWLRAAFLNQVIRNRLCLSEQTYPGLLESGPDPRYGTSSVSRAAPVLLNTIRQATVCGGGGVTWCTVPSISTGMMKSALFTGW